MECHDDGRIVNKLEDVDMVDLQASKKQKGLLGTIEFLGNKLPHPSSRTEERRVGKECRSRWSPYH